MSKLLITGGKRIDGAITAHGAKNSALPLLAATLLCGGECVLHNCPNLSDVDAAAKILGYLGCHCKREGDTVIVDSSVITKNEIPDELMREMRSSIVFLGAIIGRTGGAVVSSPGGCELGPRPIDLHISSLKKMGVTIREDHGYLKCVAQDGLYGTDITLQFPSVGATENIILAAALAKGETVIHNAAKEPEIVDLADFLNKCGADISGAGNDTIRIVGVDKLTPAEHSVIPDRIEAATYLAAAAVTGSKVTVKNVNPAHMRATLNIFKECGCHLTYGKDEICIERRKHLISVPMIKTLVYPGFPTDAGPPILTMLALADSCTLFVENIFQNRFKYIDELKRLGAKITTHSNVALVEGCKKFTGAKTAATDLRGGAALVVAALAADGVTEIDNIYHIDRGYEKIERCLSSLGADIKRI